MSKLFSWTQNPTFSNKWDRLALTKKGAFVAAWVSQHNDVFCASIFNNRPGEPAIIEGEFKSLEEAQQFADKELKTQEY